MEHLQSLPFKVGDRVEIKSFELGYRAAWFRYEALSRNWFWHCIHLFNQPYPQSVPKLNKVWCYLRNYDYFQPPITMLNAGITWMKIWQKEELMLRPKFPPIYHENEAPDVNTLSEVIVVTNGAWKVGDLVDFLWRGAYWSATITEVLGDDKVQLQTPPQPVGEGTLDEAFCRDLRPSLEWSQTSGWKLLTPKENKSYRPCARLIEPVKQGKLRNERKKDIENESPSGLNASASRSSARSLPSSHTERGPMIQTPAEAEKDDADRTRSCSDSSFIRASAEEVDGPMPCSEHNPENNEAGKRIELNRHIPLTSSTCDSIESLITDMEELLNRVKWMKRLLDPPESGPFTWKFQD